MTFGLRHIVLISHNKLCVTYKAIWPKQVLQKKLTFLQINDLINFKYSETRL